ncbi:MAG: glycosyltransferase family 2 protein, partial [Pirellulales bacterium]
MPVHAVKARLERLAPWRRLRGTNGQPPKRSDEQPLRAELLNVDQLQRHAELLAVSHRLATGRLPDKLIARLDENERVLVEAHELVTAAAKRNRRIAPAAEWLLDNFYLIEDQVRTARRHLPRAYSRELPRLAGGPASSYPRVYGIVLELIAHVDGRVDADSVNSFLAAYQKVAPLQLGELWAVPIMLRLALIENLRRVAARLASGRRDQDLADDWAEQMLEVVERNPTDLVLVLADMARANPPMSGAFLAELTRHLQGQSPHFAFANSWLEHRLSEQGLTTERLVLAEGQAQAADQVSMGNSITSLRFLSANDWRAFVEQHSQVERTLKEDPVGVYARMDFATRDRYRHVVEEVAKRSRQSEYEVAREAIQLAQAVATERPDDRTAHVGYYLIDRGRAALERSAEMRATPRMVAGRLGRRFPLFFYLCGVLLVTVGATDGFFRATDWEGARGWPVVSLILALLCATHLGVGIVNWLATLFVRPRRLPRMDFSGGIPPEHRTLVVVPTMLSCAEGVADLLEALEVRFLANRDEQLHFGLLTDFEDASQETMPADEELVRLAREGVELLNAKYAKHRPDAFYLFHRPRRWNAQEGIWMGYERKRGKLAALNALLRGGARNRFSQVVGDTSVLPDVRYVITLDTDTQLPRDSAREMVGTMAHRLNRPVLDRERRRVVEGYGILQPRVGVSLPSAHRSWYVRLFAGDAGIDPYTRVVSDVYQDLFGEGSFVGKGIYDVDAFEQSCGGFPENAILSHDLLESAHARSALLSDVELYEDYPSRYPADVSRRHRWMRGDWQIAWWLLPWVPRLAAGRVENPINALSWWKIFDNLRRSLLPIAMLGLLLTGWLLAGPRIGAAATIFVLALIGAVPLLSALSDLLRKPPDLPLLAHLRVTSGASGKQAAQFLFTLVFLAYDAYLSFDAIARTLVRVLWTKKNLLEWKTASSAERGAPEDLAGFFRTMWFVPAIAVMTTLVVSLFHPESLAAVLPLAGLWMISPAVAWWLSRPLAPPPVRLSSEQRVFLEMLSRQTWRYFEAFVTAEENWLPPDNFQEHPAPVIASRTSPTNIGMALLANLAACDFGYCSVGRLLERSEQTLDTLGRMDRYRGHFYNWYDTRSLKPLRPLYISTVDSGNLVGHVLVLRSGLLELAESKLPPSRVVAGLRDTLRVMLNVARGHERMGKDSVPLVPADVLRKIERLEQRLDIQPDAVGGTTTLLSRLVVDAAEIKAAAIGDKELLWWASAF